MESLLLIAGVITLSAGVVWSFRSATSGAAFALLGISALKHSDYFAINSTEMLYWAVAVLIILIVGWNNGWQIAVPKICRNYIVGGTLVGMMVGLTKGHSAMIIASVVGAVVGSIAYGRTSAGASLSTHLRWAIVKIGLPAIVTMTLVGMAVEGLMNR